MRFRLFSRSRPPAPAAEPAAAPPAQPPSHPPHGPAPDPEAWLWELVRDNTFASREKLINLRQLLRTVSAQGLGGDVVECGTYKGGSAAVLGTALHPEQRLWLYDSFQGMPAVTAKDGPDAGQYVGLGTANVQEVERLLDAVGVGTQRRILRPGWFLDSFREPLPERVAFLHCDADWYESVLLVLRTFYPRLVPGGCVVLDDFGYWEGCREAFYDFCKETGEKPLLERFSIEQAWWFKGRTHNRLVPAAAPAPPAPPIVAPPIVAPSSALATQPARAPEVSATPARRGPRWSSPTEFDEVWKRRLAAMVAHVGGPGVVADFGCGMMWLEALLPPGCTYLPIDYLRRDARTVVVDLNRDPLPELAADVAVLSGVLEYVRDVPGFARQLASGRWRRIIASYCTTDKFPDRTSRRALDWVSDESLESLVRCFLPTFALVALDDVNDNTILVFERKAT